MSQIVLPSEKAIRRHWVDRLWKRKGFDSPTEFLETGLCFACGMVLRSAQRAHIKARSAGGSDGVENLHMLCHWCHKDSEHLEGFAYWRWLLTRTAGDMFLSVGARHGKNVWSLLQGGRQCRLTTPYSSTGYASGWPR
jgi:hypothetical protein